MNYQRLRGIALITNGLKFLPKNFVSKSVLFGSIEELPSSNSCLLAWFSGISGLLLASTLPQLQITLALTALFLVFVFKFSSAHPILFMLAGICWASWNFNQHYNTELPSQYESISIKISGQVVGLPNTNSERTKFRFRINDAATDDLQMLNGQVIQLSCYRCKLQVLPDHQWQFTVRLKRPHGYSSWAAFDYEKFLFRHKIIATGYVRQKEDNQFLAVGSWSVNQYRWQIRQHLDDVLRNHRRAKGMIAALMIGDKSWLSQDQQQAFQATGVSHLMAISGLHVGLVFIAVATLFKWLFAPLARIYLWQPRQRLALFPALMAAFAYSALAGFAVSTQRAFIMLSVFVLCRIFARETSLQRVLLLAAAILLVLDPFSILDVGFWLSCGAVLIISLASRHKGTLTLVRLQPILWLGMIPLSTLFFGQISLISPLVNLLMVPLFCLVLIPLVLLSLILMQLNLDSLHNWLIEALGWAFNGVDFALTELHQLPFALYFPSSLVFWQLSLITLVLLSYLVTWRWRHFAVVLLALTLILDRSDGLTADEVWITLLDVGQGLSMVVEARDYVMVYDTGPAYASGFNTASAVLIPYLRYRGISKVDLLIISHADNDHIGGLPYLLEAYKVDQILTSRVDKIPNAINCFAGQFWQAGEIRFNILSPQSDTPEGSNNRSCVLMVNNDYYRALITGDIEKSVEKYLLQTNLSLAADLLLVPHQGSKTSSTEQFVDAVNPRVAIVAAGYLNHYGHPHASIVKRYQKRDIELLSTVSSGSIQLKIKGDNWFIQNYRDRVRGFWKRRKEPI